MRLKDKTAVVTGAASGIGRATAETLAAEGAYVFLGDIDEEKGRAAAAELSGRGLGAEFIRLDVTDLASIAQCKQQAYARRGHVDIVANVAGWGRIQPFMENTPEFWRKVIDLNLLGPVAVSHAFLDKMIERGSGKVVIVASDAGRVGSLGETVYSGAKGGAIAFTKSLAREVARYGINVNCVCPGPTDTPLLDTRSDKLKDAFVRAIAFRRLGKPQEIADAIVFFAGQKSSYVTAQVLSVSGGLTFAG